LRASEVEIEYRTRNGDQSGTQIEAGQTDIIVHKQPQALSIYYTFMSNVAGLSTSNLRHTIGSTLEGACGLAGSMYWMELLEERIVSSDFVYCYRCSGNLSIVVERPPECIGDAIHISRGDLRDMNMHRPAARRD